MREIKWEDITIRESCNGYHYLLQMKTLDNGKKVFRNRSIDHNHLFHGFQNIINGILKTNQSHN